MWLLALLIAVPIIEIALFIQVGGAIGLWPTLAIVIGTALLGANLLRAQGRGAMMDLQASLSGRGDPGKALAHGALILVAGVLLLTPGFFTDTVGFLLLIPQVRAAVIAWGAKNVRVGGTYVHMEGFERRGPPPGGPGHRPPYGGETIEGEFEEVDPGEAPSRGSNDGTNRGRSGWTRPD